MISREMLEGMFDGMRSHGQWNVDGPLLWGYFFTALDRDNLEAAANALQKDGYDLVNIWQMDAKDADNTDLWWLHVERTEHHTVDSLLERNVALYALAECFDLGSYDGMDAGPVAGSVQSSS